jgi:hypothetical protein
VQLQVRCKSNERWRRGSTKAFEERNTSPFVVEIDGKVVYHPFNNPEHAQEQAEAEAALEGDEWARKATTTPPRA